MCKKNLQKSMRLLILVSSLLHTPLKQAAPKNLAKGLTITKAKKLSREQEEVLLKEAQEKADSAQAEMSLKKTKEKEDVSWQDILDLNNLLKVINSPKEESSKLKDVGRIISENKKIVNHCLARSYNITPLMLAVKQNLEEITLILLDAGADPNLKNNQKVSALMLAAQNGHENILQRLLEKGADPHLQNKQKVSALMLATQNGHVNIVARLLHAGADPNLKGINESTASMIAAGEGYKEILAMLLHAGADPNIQNNHGDTALMHAADKDNKDVLLTLLNNGADPRLQNKEGANAFICAKVQGFIAIAKIIEKYQLAYDLKQKSDEVLLRTAYQAWQCKAKNSIVEKNKGKLLIAEEKFRRKFLSEEQRAIDDMLTLEQHEWDRVDPIIKLRKDLEKISDWRDEWDEKTFQDARKYQGLQ